MKKTLTKYILHISLLLVLISCKTSATKTLSIANLDTTVNMTNISIRDLAKNYKSYHGKYVQTTGHFYQAFEQFAIYTPRPFLGERKGFWLESDNTLAYDSIFFANANGKEVTFIGIVDTLHRGHLGMYLATISNIHFWESH